MKKITEEEFLEAQADNKGYCTHCEDFTAEGVEPDANEYECPDCHRNTVYGAEEALLLMFITV